MAEASVIRVEVIGFCDLITKALGGEKKPTELQKNKGNLSGYFVPRNFGRSSGIFNSGMSGN